MNIDGKRFYGTCLWRFFAGLLIFGLLMPVSARAQRAPAEFGARPVEMSLAEAIVLALRHNRSVQSAYLDRVRQKYDLKVAEDKFIPDVILDVGGGVSGSDTSGGSSAEIDSDTFSTTLSVIERIPTGGAFTFAWARDLANSSTNDRDTARDDTGSWKISFAQPLLKGGGINVNTASVASARIQEQSNILSLKSTLMGTVDAVVTAYRSFLQAQRQVEISRASLARARATLETNQLLIETGRMAAVEIVQTRADIANREFAYHSTVNSLDNARLTLLKTLDMDIHKFTRIFPVTEEHVELAEPELKRCIKIAFAHRPDWLQANLDKRLTEIAVMLAENNMLWDLSLDASWQDSRADDRLNDILTNRDAWQVGLKLSVPVYGELTRKQGLLSARTTDKKAKIGLEELRSNIQIEVKDFIREVVSRKNQLKLARLAMKLSVQKLEIEQEKLKAGRSSNFQVVTFQNDLVSAQQAETDAVIAYRNSLTALDRALGTTLETWKIEFKSE